VLSEKSIYLNVFLISKIHLNEWSKKTIVQKEIYKNTSKENGYKPYGT
jgi:hypothetical protein